MLTGDAGIPPPLEELGELDEIFNSGNIQYSSSNDYENSNEQHDSSNEQHDSSNEQHDSGNEQQPAEDSGLPSAAGEQFVVLCSVLL